MKSESDRKGCAVYMQAYASKIRLDNDGEMEGDTCKQQSGTGELGRRLDGKTCSLCVGDSHGGGSVGQGRLTEGTVDGRAIRGMYGRDMYQRLPQATTFDSRALLSCSEAV